MKNLVIVESPAKAKTIEKYLGSDFTVLSSVGHIRSIAKKTKNGTPPIDVKNNFETTYEIDSDKAKIISGLKKAVKVADTIWLATDEDREGEAIAWHLCEVLKLNITKTNRIVFHEITKDAISEAIQKPRHIDMDLVKAQQARQILDRLVGFELSPVVWRKVPGGKSAGRVQSPAVRLLVEREREIEAFSGQASFKVTAQFKNGENTFKAELSEKFPSENEAKKFLESLIQAHFKVFSVTKSPAMRNPSAPFTTSTLQQEANSRLGFSAKATMSSAQKLYQEGKITYMRTDSITLSQQILAQASAFIKEKYGDEYSEVRNFKTKSASAQEAHEAIRPTNLALEKASSNEYDQKLYDLIRRRTLASQMKSAKIEKTTITIDISNNKSKFEAKGEVILFDGFLKVYGTNKFETETLPRVNSGDNLDVAIINAKQIFSRPPARYSEGSLVKKLEDLGIGRPSTYATIINTVQVRGYAIKGVDEGETREAISLNLENGNISREILQEKTGSNRGKLVPTPAGEVVSDFLVNHFKQIVDYSFTADVEKYFDKIANGKLDRNKMLTGFYEPFHKLIDNSGDIDRSSVTKSREIGKDPKTGKLIIARFGKFGPMLQLGEATDQGDKPQFAPMPANKKIETVTLEEALHAFKLPRLIGKTAEGVDIKANVGRFGPYIQIDKLYVNIKDLDPQTITLDEALELYKEKLQSEKDKNIAEFDNGVKVLKGRFGPYVTDGKKNAKIPKDVDPKSIDKDKAISLLKSAPKTNKKRFVRTKKTPKK